MGAQKNILVNALNLAQIQLSREAKDSGQDLFPKGIPYHPISAFYKRTFGGRTYKIPVTVAQSCPNRDGLKGMETCIFCDPWGSAAYPELGKMHLRTQIQKTKEHLSSLGNPQKFLVYFQSYTTTYQKVSQLRTLIEETEKLMNDPDSMFCKGFVIGTRPDCLSASIYNLINDYLDKGFFVSVELGVQSFYDHQLKWMRRGHNSEKSLKAIELLNRNCPSVDIGLHFIFGLPDETDEMIKTTALKCNKLPIGSVKLHNLHVLKKTHLEKMYLRGEFKPLNREAYTQRIVLFLEHLMPEIPVQRLAALAANHEELVAPEWTRNKMETYQFITDKFRELGTYQGRCL